jgi:CotH protein.
MTWEKGGPIKFGPVWDFDLGFGNESRDDVKPSSAWYIRNYNWNAKIFWIPDVKEQMTDYWNENKEKFRALIDSVPVYRAIIEKALKNEYKRWPVIRNTENWALKDPYDSYDEAVEYMIQWMKERYDWIEGHL